MPEAPPDAGGGNTLHVENVDVTYGRALSALRSVSLTVPPATVVALLGANGGKQDHAAARRLRHAPPAPRRGHGRRIRYGDTELDGKDPVAAVRAGVVQVPEGRRVFAGLSVDENLRSGGLGLGRRGRAQVQEARDRVFTLFPRLAERTHQPQGCCPAASSRCWRSAAP